MGNFKTPGPQCRVMNWFARPNDPGTLALCRHTAPAHFGIDFGIPNLRIGKNKATKKRVSNRGVPPVSFLDELVAWAKAAPGEIFAPNTNSGDVYSAIAPVLGPWKGLQHRKAVMLEVMRVLAGFESSWNWNEGRDVKNTPTTSPLEEVEAGAWQVSANSLAWGQDLRDLVQREIGAHDPQNANQELKGPVPKNLCNKAFDPAAFQEQMKQNHWLAMEYIARLLRHTTQANGPVKRHEIDQYLHKDAVAEFELLLRIR